MVKVKINETDNYVLFKRMNQAVINEYKSQLGVRDVPSMGEHLRQFEEKYDVKIHCTNWGNWDSVEFPSEEAYMMAVLKWL